MRSVPGQWDLDGHQVDQRLAKISEAMLTPCAQVGEYDLYLARHPVARPGNGRNFSQAPCCENDTPVKSF